MAGVVRRHSERYFGPKGPDAQSDICNRYAEPMRIDRQVSAGIIAFAARARGSRRNCPKPPLPSGVPPRRPPLS